MLFGFYNYDQQWRPFIATILLLGLICGSGYPRSELREMTSSGSANASWSTTSGTHTMEIRQAITHLPVVKPHVVAGQIHDAGDDVIVCRLEGSKLFIDQNGVNGPVLTTNYQTRDHGFMVLDTLYGQDEAYNARPQMLEGHTTEAAKLDGLRDGLLEVVAVLREEAREDFGPAKPRRAG